MIIFGIRNKLNGKLMSITDDLDTVHSVYTDPTRGLNNAVFEMVMAEVDDWTAIKSTVIYEELIV